MNSKFPYPCYEDVWRENSCSSTYSVSCLQKVSSARRLRGIWGYDEVYCVLVREGVTEQAAVRRVAVSAVRDVLRLCTQSEQTSWRCIAFSYKRLSNTPYMLHITVLVSNSEVHTAAILVLKYYLASVVCRRHDVSQVTFLCNIRCNIARSSAAFSERQRRCGMCRECLSGWSTLTCVSVTSADMITLCIPIDVSEA